MTWWRGQNLERPTKGRDGGLWHFRVWHGAIDNVHTELIFFWDDAKEFSGLLKFAGDQTLHVSKLKQRMRRIVTDPVYRKRHLCPLSFPVERYYP